MIVRTVRIYKYLYDQIKMMAQYFGVSINKMIIELLEIGFMEKESELKKRGK